MRDRRPAEAAAAHGDRRPLANRLRVDPELHQQPLPAHFLGQQPDAPHRARMPDASQQLLDLELLGRSGGHAVGTSALQVELIDDQLRYRHLAALQFVKQRHCL